MRRVWAAAVLVVGAAGCAAGGDQTNDRLEAGSQAVAVIPDGWRDKEVALYPSDFPERIVYGAAKLLPPGTRVTVGNDPGYSERTQKDIDRSIDLASDNPELVEHIKKEKPAKFYPPNPDAKTRKVAVVVETGEYKGKAGLIERRCLRPAAP